MQILQNQVCPETAQAFAATGVFCDLDSVGFDIYMVWMSPFQIDALVFEGVRINELITWSLIYISPLVEQYQ